MTGGLVSNGVFRATLLWLFGVAGAAALIFMVPIDARLISDSGLDLGSLRLISLFSSAVVLAVAVTAGCLVARQADLRSLIAQPGALRLGFDIWAARAVLIGITFGFVIYVLDWTMFRIVPGLSELMESQLSLVREPWLTVGARMFYGGVTEEILLRWGSMSLLAWLLIKVIGNRDVAMWIAIVLAALAFGVGHLPALFGLVPDAPAVLVARTIGLNFIAGVVFGYLFWRHSLEIAMITHAATRIGMAAAQGVIFF